MNRHHPHTLALLKFGGDVILDALRLVAVMQDVSTLTKMGWRFLLCHGGNPQANALTLKLGLKKIHPMKF